MRKLTRSILAATTVVALLAFPVAGAGADDGTTMVNMTLTGTVGTVSINVPQDVADTDSTIVDLGDVTAGATQTATLGNLGEVVVTDGSVGLLRSATVSVDSALADTLTGLCIDSNNNPSDGVTCSEEANTSVLSAAVGYNFGTVSTTGANGDLTPPAAVDAFLNAAELVYATTEAGSYEVRWNPSFSVALTGAEVAGEYYGLIKHTATATTVSLP